MEIQNKVAVVSGGAHGIGQCICEEFEKIGVQVCIIDLKENSYFQGDLADKNTLERFAQKVIKTMGMLIILSIMPHRKAAALPQQAMKILSTL